jgi:hypothetical protein
MANRDAPTAPHPAPAEDWILGEDGHWRPPPFRDAPRQRRLDRTIVVGPEVPPKPQKIGPAVIVSMILVIAALSYLAYVALLA